MCRSSSSILSSVPSVEMTSSHNTGHKHNRDLSPACEKSKRRSMEIPRALLCNRVFFLPVRNAKQRNHCLLPKRNWLKRTGRRDKAMKSVHQLKFRRRSQSNDQLSLPLSLPLRSHTVALAGPALLLLHLLLLRQRLRLPNPDHPKKALMRRSWLGRPRTTSLNLG